MKLALALVLFTGCGEVTRIISDAGPTGGDGDEVRLVSTSPSDGEVTVDILRPIVITFSGEREPPAVHVFERASKREVASTTSWDPAAHALTVALARPMSYGVQYRVETEGFSALRFRTYIGHALSSISYDTEGGPISSETTALDPDGFADVTSEFGRGALVAQDDEDYRSDGELVRRVVRDSTDQITVWQDLQPTDSGVAAIITYNGAGPDGMWLTADDRISGTATTAYDDRDRIASQTIANGAGMTTSTTSFAYAGDSATATTASADGTVTRIQRLTYDPSGRLVETRTFDGAHKQVERMVYAYDPTTLLETQHAAWEAGPDNLWNTSDDRPRLLYDTTYDNAHRRTHFTTHDVGADGVAHTADDRLVTTFGFGSPL